jgi:hypothetical protein
MPSLSIRVARGIAASCRQPILIFGAFRRGVRLHFGTIPKAASPDTLRRYLGGCLAVRFVEHSALRCGDDACLHGSIASAQQPAQPLTVPILYVEEQVERPPVLSNLIAVPEDEGAQGARLAISDNNTTGQFLNQTYELQEVVVGLEDDLTATLSGLLSGGPKLAVLNMSADALKGRCRAAGGCRRSALQCRERGRRPSRRGRAARISCTRCLRAPCWPMP